MKYTPSHHEHDPVILGSRYAPSWAELYPFHLSVSDRRRHLFVLGQTGTGKSTFLKDIIKQDILAGRGVAYIDPHGDDSAELLRSIPSWRARDVIYFNASDFDHPIVWNLLASDTLEASDRDRVASIIVSGFQGIFGSSWGPQLEYVLYGCLHTLLARGNTSILGIERLITDREYRAHVLRFVTDSGVRMFWQNFEKQEDQHKEATSSVINKIGRLSLSPTLRNIFGSAENRIRPRTIMDERKILIVNLAKGAIGEEAARLIGASLISQFYSASLTRRDTPESERVDFSLVVDEFASFQTTSIANILSESRKYRMNVILANQYLGQLSEEVEQAIFGNPGAVISFRVGEEDAATLAKHFGDEYQPHHFSALDNYTIAVKQLVDGMARAPFIGRTHRLEMPVELDGEKVRYMNPEVLVRQSRLKVASHRQLVEAKLERWMSKDHSAPGKRSGHRKAVRQVAPAWKQMTNRTDSIHAQIRKHALARTRKPRPIAGAGFARLGELM